MSEQKGLYKYKWDFGRMGRLEGLFLALPSEVQSAIGKEFDFGEALGKHSEIEGEIEPDDLKLVTDDPGDVAVIERLFGQDNICGRNPLKCLVGAYECPTCGERHDSGDDASLCCEE